MTLGEKLRPESHPVFPATIGEVFRPGVLVVDFGCGLFPLWGWEMSKLHGITYHGIDRNSDFVEGAKEWIDLWKSQPQQPVAVPTIEQGDYFSPYNGDPADVVIVNMPEVGRNFLARVRNGEFAQAIWQRLKPNGLAIIYTQTGHYPRGTRQIMHHDSYVSVISGGNLAQRTIIKALGRQFGADNVTSGNLPDYMQHLLTSYDLPGEKTFILARKPL